LENRQVRILQIVQKPQRRGAEIFAYQLSQALREQGQVVQTVYLYPHTRGKSLPLHQNDVVLGGQETHFLEKLMGIHPKLLQKLTGTIRQFRPDVIQVNGGRAVKYGAFAKRFSRNRKWVLIYKNIDNPNYWIRDKRHLLFYRTLVMPQLDGVVGVSEETLNKVRTLYNLKVPSVYIPNGRDLSQLRVSEPQAVIREQLGTAPDVSVVLFMGSLTTQKRPDRFLRVVRTVRGKLSNVEAWLLGDGPLRENLMDLVNALGIQDIVRFWGYQEQVAPYIIASDLLLLTSDSEGTPGVVLETAFLGRPAVATDVGGTSGCILDRKTGILVDSEDEAALAQFVLMLLQNPARRIEMGHRAAQWVRGKFTIEEAARKYTNFYQQIVPRF
jgi:glycosyltransferase involved in cell wall biosynthesis